MLAANKVIVITSVTRIFIAAKLKFNYYSNGW